MCMFKKEKNTESKNPKLVRTKNGRIILLINCVMCNHKKSKFIKELGLASMVYIFLDKKTVLKMKIFQTKN